MTWGLRLSRAATSAEHYETPEFPAPRVPCGAGKYKKPGKACDGFAGLF